MTVLETMTGKERLELVLRIEERIRTIERIMLWDMDDEEKWKRANQRINNLKAEIIEIKMSK